ncbi:MAG TPA: N-6 DNA methylase, partial [Bacteroidales bacterium]|nr:N-6 DNA methylase [Bacteroidales bacterium]
SREFTDEDISKVASTYHNWRTSTSIGHQDIPGYCKSVTIDEIREKNYVLTPGRYIGLPDEEDDFNFPERFNSLKAEFEKQIAEESVLNKTIMENLKKIQI